MVTMHGDGPGKPAWREELRDSMTEVLREIATDYIELGAGAPALLGRKSLAEKVRILLSWQVLRGALSGTTTSPGNSRRPRSLNTRCLNSLIRLEIFLSKTRRKESLRER